MKVRELIEALGKSSPDAEVELWDSQHDRGEFPLRVVTKSGRYTWPRVLLTDTDADMSVGEVLLHKDEDIPETCK